MSSKTRPANLNLEFSQLNFFYNTFCRKKSSCSSGMPYEKLLFVNVNNEKTLQYRRYIINILPAPWFEKSNVLVDFKFPAGVSVVVVSLKKAENKDHHILGRVPCRCALASINNHLGKMTLAVSILVSSYTAAVSLSHIFSNGLITNDKWGKSDP